MTPVCLLFLSLLFVCLIDSQDVFIFPIFPLMLLILLTLLSSMLLPVGLSKKNLSVPTLRLRHSRVASRDNSPGPTGLQLVVSISANLVTSKEQNGG